MEHLNFCRQITKQFTDNLRAPRLPYEYRELMESVLAQARTAEKFMLPVGGRPYDDPQLRALDEAEELRLPFPRIVLEYVRPALPVIDGTESCGKVAIFLMEGMGGIQMIPVNWYTKRNLWVPFPPVLIESTSYLDRSMHGPHGEPGIMIRGDIGPYKPSDYNDEAGSVFCFLNLLRCSNVQIETSQPRNAGKHIKSALPFDSYRILTIGATTSGEKTGGAGTGRHPRQHLRRGHIRRLEDGRRIWVNAAIVAAGNDGGKLSKSYAVR